MNLLKKNTLLIVCVVSVLSGCISTASHQTRATDPGLFEQKNLEIAQGFLIQGLPARAIGRLQAIIKVKPDSAPAYGLLAVVYQHQGEYGLALKNFRRSLRLNPQASDVRNNYGVLLYEQKRYKEALREFQRVTGDVYYERRSRAFENMGLVSLRLNRQARAASYFQRAVRLENSLWRAHLELAAIAWEKGDVAQADRHFKTVELARRSAHLSSRALFLGIKIAKRLQDDARVQRYAEQLARLHPGSEEYRAYQVSLSYE